MVDLVTKAKQANEAEKTIKRQKELIRQIEYDKKLEKEKKHNAKLVAKLIKDVLGFPCLYTTHVVGKYGELSTYGFTEDGMCFKLDSKKITWMNKCAICKQIYEICPVHSLAGFGAVLSGDDIHWINRATILHNRNHNHAVLFDYNVEGGVAEGFDPIPAGIEGVVLDVTNKEV